MTEKGYIQVTVEVKVEDIGAGLICDDPEGRPLTTWGCAVQSAVAQKLGWTQEIEDRLWQKARETGLLEPYHRLVELAQIWAGSIIAGLPEMEPDND